MWFYYLRGVAHAVIITGFALSAAGKLVGCKHGAKAMCYRALPDTALVIGAFCLGSDLSELVVAGTALSIALLGWILDFNKKADLCNCYGVLSLPLSSAHGTIRAAIMVATLFLMGMRLAPVPTVHEIDLTSSGMSVGLFICFFSLATYMSETFLSNKRPAEITASVPAALRPFDLETFVGHTSSQRPSTVRDVIAGSASAMLLVTSKDCHLCHAVAADLADLAGSPVLPIPLATLSNCASFTSDANRFELLDADERFRTTVGLTAVPALIVMNRDGQLIRSTLYLGSEAIKSAVIAVLMRSKSEAVGL